MFYYIEGMVSILEQNMAVLDVNGVGYACYVTANTISHIETGKKARLYTYCNVREDIFDIYGFYDLSEKRCFELLISVSGVGPRAALSVLSSQTPTDLALAIINNDERALTAAPGIGKRIAQRIILELKDKISKESEQIKSSGFVAPQLGVGSKAADAASALAVLGYSQSEISAVMRNIDIDKLSVEDIIREALKSSFR